MVEQGGSGMDREKNRTENPTVLHFNVSDFEAAALVLVSKGVAVARRVFDWGRIGVVVDPDGNCCELTSAA